MILVADSGSSKTHWQFISKDETVAYETIGLNPYFVNSAKVAEVFNPSIDLSKVEKVFFYGAGCSNEPSCAIIKKGLIQKIPNAKIEVTHDLLAAARATCGNVEGIACILGTGSNSCFFDGEKIKKNVPSLAYIIGDEGSGGDMGKELLRRYFYKELSEDLMHQFKLMFDLDVVKVLDRTYNQPFPNRFLASFTQFLADNIDTADVQEIVEDSFSKFFNRHISKYKHYKSLHINFVGSIAKVFEQQLVRVADKYSTQIGEIIQSPINNLVAYHKKDL